MQSCRLDRAIEPKSPDAANTTDFSKYISIGDSQTAGYTNDGLYREAQLTSYPSIIAAQMKAAGGGTFSQPLFDEAQANGSGYLKLIGFNPDGSPIINGTTDKLAVRATNNVPTYYTKYSGSNNNFGIPGIKLADINNAAYGNINPYYERLLPNIPPNNTTTYQDFITANSFTFFTCWLGNNDVLSYATSGGTSVLPTDKNSFLQLYNVLAARLTAKDQKGAIATIPDVSAIPYFNTVTVAAINTSIKIVNPMGALYINARSSASVGDTLHIVRKAEGNDLITLTFDAKRIGQLVNTKSGPKPYGLSPLAPVENKYVLDYNETNIVRDYTASYNSNIKTIALSYNLALFDAYSFLNQLKQGISVDGINVNATFITGGAFSLDGVHPTPRGYAMEANEFIKAINTQYHTSIKTVNVSAYKGVLP